MERCNKRELTEIDECNIFKLLSRGKSPPPGYKRIPCHFAFDVKFDVRGKAKLIAGSSRIDPTAKLCFAGVVGIESMRLSLFLGILNKFISCAADCEHTFLHGIT